MILNDLMKKWELKNVTYKRKTLKIKIISPTKLY